MISFLGKVELETLSDRLDGLAGDEYPLFGVLLRLAELKEFGNNQDEQTDHESTEQRNKADSDAADVSQGHDVAIADSRHRNDDHVELIDERLTIHADFFHLAFWATAETVGNVTDAKDICEHNSLNEQHNSRSPLGVVDERRLENESEAWIEVVIPANVATISVRVDTVVEEGAHNEVQSCKHEAQDIV